MYALYQMTLWLDKDNDKESIEIINKTLEEMFWAISDNTINLYTDSFYVRNNIWAFVWIKKRILNLDETVEIRDYINRVFEKRIVYRVLSDIISCGEGSYGYSYYIEDNTIETMFLNTDLIENAIASILPSNETEKFILKVYLEYKYGTPDRLDRKEVIVKEPIDLDLTNRE